MLYFAPQPGLKFPKTPSFNEIFHITVKFLNLLSNFFSRKQSRTSFTHGCGWLFSSSVTKIHHRRADRVLFYSIIIVSTLRKQTGQSLGWDEYDFPLTSDPAGNAPVIQPGGEGPAAAALVGNRNVGGGCLFDLTACWRTADSSRGAQKSHVGWARRVWLPGFPAVSPSSVFLPSRLYLAFLEGITYYERLWFCSLKAS